MRTVAQSNPRHELEMAQRVSMIVMLAYTGDKRLRSVMSIAGRARVNV